MNLKQLAETLGLSQTTVSRALNGYPEVSEKTRHKVVHAARLHDYQPNPRAKGLATGKAMAIGHIIPISGRLEMVNPIFGDFIAGAGEVYSGDGYDMVLSLVNMDAQEQAYRNIKTRGSVDGVVIHGPQTNDPRLQLLSDIGLPFVVHGRAGDLTTPYSWVDVNNRRAFLDATAFLLGLGHRRIGLLNGQEHMDFAIRRRQGFEDAFRDCGLAPDRKLMATGEMTESYGHKAARAMLALPDRPTAFVVSSIITAFGVRRAIEEAGHALGRDISVVTFDDDLSYLQNEADIPVFTSTRSSVRAAGEAVARMLLDQIANPGLPPDTLLLEAELIIGTSTGPAPAA